MAAKKYDDLSKDELIRLLESRDRRDATRFGLVWEANEIERDKALNQDFVALDLDPALSCGRAPWKNLIIEGDNFDALRYLRMNHPEIQLGMQATIPREWETPTSLMMARVI